MSRIAWLSGQPPAWLSWRPSAPSTAHSSVNTRSAPSEPGWVTFSRSAERQKPRWNPHSRRLLEGVRQANQNRLAESAAQEADAHREIEGVARGDGDRR